MNCAGGIGDVDHVFGALNGHRHHDQVAWAAKLRSRRQRHALSVDDDRAIALGLLHDAKPCFGRQRTGRCVDFVLGGANAGSPSTLYRCLDNGADDGSNKGGGQRQCAIIDKLVAVVCLTGP